MTAQLTPSAPSAAGRSAPRSDDPRRAPLPWRTGLAVAGAVLLAGVPVGSIVRGGAWGGHALAAVALVVALGLLLHRAGAVVVVLGQCLGVLLLVTGLFADGAVLGVLPGPAAFASFGSLITGAGRQIAVGVAPVAATPEILLLVTAAVGGVTVAVYLAAVLARAPAAAGVPLLAVFAVPAALDDQLLPWAAMVCACAGFGLLLVNFEGGRQRGRGGAAIVAVAVGLALVVGMLGSAVGTAGRFNGSGVGPGGGGAIGLSPFTALRGQLTQAAPRELFRIRNLPQATYLRALTLRDYVPNTGWQATRPQAGPALPGPLAPDPGPAGDVAGVQVENVGFRDYWLPLVGSPVAVSGLPSGQWTYDQRSGTAYTARPRAEQSWNQQAALATPTAAQLRAATGGPLPDRGYLSTAGIDPRIAAIARQVTAGRKDAFDQAIALQDYFTGPTSAFHYSLSTRPGNGDDALVEFLTTGKQGYCEQFSAAMAVMLRSLGVPARIAVGFTAGTEQDGYRSVSTSDAHAWVEAWFPRYGWESFDPTPLTDGRTVTPPYVAEAQAQAAGTAQAQDQATPTPAPGDPTPAAAPSAAPTPPPDATPPTPDGGASTVPPWPFLVALGLLVLVGLACAPALLRARVRRARLAAVQRGGPEATAQGWAELLAESVDRGVPARESDTIRLAARRLVREHGIDDEGQDGLRAVVGAVEASWYGSDHPAAGELSGPVDRVRSALATGSPLSWRARLLPRSLADDLHAQVSALRGRLHSEREATPARTGDGSAPPSGR